MSSLSPTARHQRIMARLQEHGEVRAADLSREFVVTAMTVWRDLQILGEQGLLKRIRGGALCAGDKSGELRFEAKASESDHAKAVIAARAVREFVRDGDVIALEGGTTVAALVDALPEQRISIVTNSLPIALRIRAGRPALPVRVLGGWLSPVSGNTTGADALKAGTMARISVCFLSSTAWDADHGPMDPNPLEIEVKRALAACSERVVMLVDSRKFLTTSASVTIHPSRLHALVTDARPPRAIARCLKAHGIRVIIASPADEASKKPPQARRDQRSRTGR